MSTKLGAIQAMVSVGAQDSDVKRLSLLSQMVSEIALSIQFDIGIVQRDRLLDSSTGLLQWLGLNAAEMLLEKPDGLRSLIQLVFNFSHTDQVRALGWMVHHAARDSAKIATYKGLISALHDLLPAEIPLEQLKCLVDSMRGHMVKLSWAEPWLFRDVIFPLVQAERANVDDACAIWVEELLSLLGSKERPPRLFDRAREGQTTNITAFLFAQSSSASQKASLGQFQSVLKRQQRIIQQPFASTSNWTGWDDALVVTMWIFSFARWCQYYLRQRDMADEDLEKMLLCARELALVRPMQEWHSESAGNSQGEQAAFLDQVEELLDPGDE